MSSRVLRLDEHDASWSARVVIAGPPTVILIAGWATAVSSAGTAPAWLAVAFALGWAQLVGL
jgi:hypothetical protein